MTQLLVIVVGCLLFAIGKLLVKHLGWPTNLQRSGHWGLALLGLAVLIPGIPTLWDFLSPRLPPFPPIEISALIEVLLLVGLAVLGYVAWTQGGGREDGGDGAKLGPRRRAVPPPPIADATLEHPDDADFTPAHLNGDDED